MAQQKIKFQDDLWYIRRVVALVEDAVKIQPDAVFFAEHLIAEIRFAEGSVRKLKEVLESSPRLKDRGEYMVLLARSTRALSDAASDLASGDGDLSHALAGEKDEIAAMAHGLRSLTAEVRDLASTAMDEGALEGDIVSGDELSELLKEETP
jgi:hypothetical protein